MFVFEIPGIFLQFITDVYYSQHFLTRLIISTRASLSLKESHNGVDHKGRTTAGEFLLHFLSLCGNGANL